MSEAGTPGNGLTSEQMRDVIRGLSSADTVDSPFGRLEFFDGLPRPDTVSAVYDALDLMRGIEAFSTRSRVPPSWPCAEACDPPALPRHGSSGSPTRGRTRGTCS
jgi:hypothetical protein